MADATEKICVLCGESCAGQPRTKDAKGRYYHKHCHDQAVRNKQQRTREQDQSAAEAFVAAEPPPVEHDDDELSLLLEESPPTMLPVGAGGSTCPSCGQTVAPNAVLCVNCGFNLQSGDAVQTNVAVTSETVPGKIIWPIPIGVISLVVAIISGGIAALNILDALLSNQPILLVRTVIPTFFAVWLLISGIGVLRRTQSGFRRLRGWAIWKTILTGICGGALFVTVLVSQESRNRYLGPDEQEFGNLLIIAFAIGLIWELWWPIFCLVWTHRDKVQKDVSNW